MTTLESKVADSVGTDAPSRGTMKPKDWTRGFRDTSERGSGEKQIESAPNPWEKPQKKED